MEKQPYVLLAYEVRIRAEGYRRGIERFDIEPVVIELRRRSPSKRRRSLINAPLGRRLGIDIPSHPRSDIEQNVQFNLDSSLLACPTYFPVHFRRPIGSAHVPLEHFVFCASQDVSECRTT